MYAMFLRITAKPFNLFVFFYPDVLGLPIVLKERDSHMIQVATGRVKYDKTAFLVQESMYTILVNSKDEYITVIGRTSEALFYGMQTLRSLLTGKDGKLKPVELPQLKIVDTARFKYRGLMLDLGRNFITVTSVLKVIDTMAALKMNRLHLHLSDDQGWRLEIPGLEELTEVHLMTELPLFYKYMYW